MSTYKILYETVSGDVRETEIHATCLTEAMILFAQQYSGSLLRKLRIVLAQ